MLNSQYNAICKPQQVKSSFLLYFVVSLSSVYLAVTILVYLLPLPGELVWSLLLYLLPQVLQLGVCKPLVSDRFSYVWQFKGDYKVKFANPAVLTRCMCA